MADTKITYEDRSRRELKAAYRIAALIGVVMIVALFIYAAVVEFFRSVLGAAEPRLPAESLEIVRHALLGMTAALFLAAGYLQKLFHSGRAAGQRSRAQRLITGAVVSCAICESVAIFGLVLFFVGGRASDFYLFAALSLLFFLVYFPRYKTWEALAKEASGSAADAKGQ